MSKHRTACNPTQKANIQYDVTNDPASSVDEHIIVNFGPKELTRLMLLAEDIALPDIFMLKATGKFQAPISLQYVQRAQCLAQHIGTTIWAFNARAVDNADAESDKHIDLSSRLFFILTSMCKLQDLTVDGDPTRKQHENRLIRRLAAFVKGEWGILHHAILRSKDPEIEHDPSRIKYTEAQLLARVRSRTEILTGQGDLSRALATFVTKARPVPLNPTLEEQMLRKTNCDGNEPDWTLSTHVDSTDRVNVTIATVKTQFHKIKKATASGMDCLTRDDLQFFLTNSTKLQLVNMMNNGDIHVDLYRFLAGAKITNLTKPKRGDTAATPIVNIRTILPGSLIYRMATASLVRENAKASKKALGPYQLAVHQHSGGEAAHTVHSIEMERFRTGVIAGSDDANGYGAVDRMIAQGEIDVRLPAFSKWFHTTYGKDIHHLWALYFDSNGKPKWAKLTNGYGQGCNAAALCYTALGVYCRQQCNEEVFHNNTLGQYSEYIDDGHSSGHWPDDRVPTDMNVAQHPVVTAVLHNMAERFSKGLQVAPAKMFFLAHDRTSFPEAQLTPIVNYVRAHVPDFADWDGPAISYLSDASATNGVGVTILGRPTGSDQFQIQEVIEVADEAIEALQRQVKLNFKKQTAYQLTRYCIISKLIHLLRTVPVRLSAPGIKKFEDALRGDEAAAWVWQQLEIAPEGTDPAELDRLRTATSMSLAEGGLGLPNLCQVSRFAHFCGFSDALSTTFAEHLDTCNTLAQADVQSLPTLADLEEEIRDFRDYIGLPLLEQAIINDTVKDLPNSTRQRLVHAATVVPKNVADLLDVTGRAKFGVVESGRERLTFQKRMANCANEMVADAYAVTILQDRGPEYSALWQDQRNSMSSLVLRTMPADRTLTLSNHEWTCTIRKKMAIADGRHQHVVGKCACGTTFSELHAERCNLSGSLTKRSDVVNKTLLAEGVETGHIAHWERRIPFNQRGKPGPTTGRTSAGLTKLTPSKDAQNRATKPTRHIPVRTA